jgi:hypothetical protein
VAAAQDGVSADVVVGLDDDDRRAALYRLDRSGQPRRPGTDNQDIRFQVPGFTIIYCCLCYGFVLRSPSSRPSLEGEEIKLSGQRKFQNTSVWISSPTNPDDEIQTSESVTTMRGKMQHPGERTVDN